MNAFNKCVQGFVRIYYKRVHFFVPFPVYFLFWCRCCTGEDGNQIVQGDLELRADCNNSGSEAQSSLHWNPGGLNKQTYNFRYPYNFNIEHNCFNLSSTDHQVNTILCLCTCVLLSKAKIIMHCLSYYWSDYSKQI